MLHIANNSIKHQLFVYTQLNDQTVLFQAIQFSISHSFKCQMSIWPKDRTLSGATTLGQSGAKSDGNEGGVSIPQNSCITGASPSDCLVSYPGYSFGESYFSAEMQSVYSTFPAEHKLFFDI